MINLYNRLIMQKEIEVMLQRSRKLTALLLSVLMCISMLSSFVLPALAVEPPAPKNTDAYAAVNAHTTKLTVTDGNVTVGGKQIAVPTEYRGEDVYLPDERVIFYEYLWAADAVGADSDGYFFIRYGDGTTWGNGKVYLVQWDKTATGGGYELNTLINTLSAKQPVVGADNNYYVVLFPGRLWTGTHNAANTFKAPVATAETPVSEMTEADYTNVHFLGPQAGRNPNAEGVTRKIDDTIEYLVEAHIHFPGNAVYHWDGVAFNNSRKLMPNWTGGTVSAFYGKNLYMASSLIINNNPTASGTHVFSIEDSYIKHDGASYTIPLVNFDVVKFKNVVMETSAANTAWNGMIQYTPKTQASNIAFLGEDRNTGRLEMTGCTFNAQVAAFLYVTSNPGTNRMKLILKDNFITGYTSQSLYYDEPAQNVDFDIQGNKFERRPGATGACYGMYMSSGASENNCTYTIKENTFVLTPANWAHSCDLYNVPANLTFGNNLFVTNDGQVRAPRVRIVGTTTEIDMNSFDAYASDLMGQGGSIRDIFTVQESSQDLLVLHSQLEETLYSNCTLGGYTGYQLIGSVTVLPETGVNYNTKDLFLFKDKKVELVGFYSDVACTTAVETLNKGFGTVYAKAQYKGTNTTATVLYAVTEPTTYHIVDPSSKGTYTFNGDTFTSANAHFYTTLADAYAAAKVPAVINGQNTVTTHSLTDVILLMPGAYAGGQYIQKTCAIVGPKFGADPNVEGLRSLDTTKEAVIGTADITVTPGNITYFTLSGVTLQSQVYITQHKSFGGVNDSMCAINFADVYSKRTNWVMQVNYQNWDGTEVAASKKNMPMYFNDCYFHEAGGSHFIKIQTSYVKMKDTTLLSEQWSSGVQYYPVNLPMKSVTGWFMEGCTITHTNAHTFSVMTFNMANAKNDQQLSFVGNTMTNKQWCKLVDVKNPAGTHLVFKNNTINNPNLQDIAIVASDAAFKSAEISGNKLLGGYKAPWSIVSGDTNVDENFYGLNTSNTGVQTIKAGDGYGVVKSGWYYLDAAMTTKNTEIALKETADYTLGEIVFDGVSNKVTLTSDKNISTDDLAIADGCEVVGIYSDAALTTPLNGQFTKEGTFYIVIKKTSNGLTLTNEVTLTVPCMHVFGKTEGTRVPETCGKDGYQEYTCNYCGEVVDAWTETIPANGNHDWDIVIIPPTCTENAYDTRSCLVCGEVQAATAIPDTALGHDFGIWYTDVAPDCDDTGVMKRDCSRCDAFETDTIKELGHVEGEPYSVPATCTENAHVDTPCNRCGEVLASVEVPDTALGHDWSDWKLTQKGDCTTDTIYTHTCQRADCGISEDDVIVAPGHAWGDWTVVTEADCENDGEQRRDCDNCDEFETLPIAATGHDHQPVTYEPTCVEDGSIQYTCTVCGDVDEALTVILPATNEHKWGEFVEKPATCVSDGLKQRYCTVCETPDVATREVLPATPDVHTFDAEGKDWVETAKGDCVTPATKERKCAYCDFVDVSKDYSNVIGVHNYEVVTTNATADQTGKVEKHCINCGDIVLVKILPRLTSFKDVKSGDWYAEYINKAVNYELLKGYEDGTVRPNANVTRAEAVTMVARMAGVNVQNYSTKKFDDVAKRAWYNGAVAWAEQNKIVSGRSDTIFAPDAQITRQELCTILVRFANFAGVDMKPTVAKAKFADDAKIAKWAKDSVYTCQRAEIVSGRPNNKFAPNEFATRAETAKILVTFMDLYMK